MAGRENHKYRSLRHFARIGERQKRSELTKAQITTRFESVRTLQIEFGTVDFQHLYDLHRWSFLKSVGGKCKYWSQFIYMLNIQFHVCDDLFDKYVVKSGFNRSFKACVYQHCSSL